MQRNRSRLTRLLLVAMLWGSAQCACAGPSPGPQNANQNLNEDQNENLNENQNAGGSPCDDGQMFIDGIPDQAVGPDSTLLLSAVLCDPQDGLTYQWTVTGPPDGAELSSPTAAQTMFFVFNPGEFSVAVTAIDALSGAALNAEGTIIAEIGGPPFNE